MSKVKVEHPWSAVFYLVYRIAFCDIFQNFLRMSFHALLSAQAFLLQQPVLPFGNPARVIHKCRELQCYKPMPFIKRALFEIISNIIGTIYDSDSWKIASHPNILFEAQKHLNILTLRHQMLTCKCAKCLSKSAKLATTNDIAWCACTSHESTLLVSGGCSGAGDRVATIVALVACTGTTRGESPRRRPLTVYWK